MKKMIAFTLTVLMLFSFAACGADAGTENENSTNESQTETGQTNGKADAVALLKNIWDSYGADERFSVVGGDYSAENNKMDEPGIFSLEDQDALDASLAFPAAAIADIDEAASLIHMMNGNTFTCGAFHIKDVNNMDAVTTAIKGNIQNRQWICGFPDKFVIAAIDDYIIAMFGDAEVIDNFKGKMTAVYSNAEIVCDEMIE